MMFSCAASPGRASNLRGMLARFELSSTTVLDTCVLSSLTMLVVFNCLWFVVIAVVQMQHLYSQEEVQSCPSGVCQLHLQASCCASAPEVNSNLTLLLRHHSLSVLELAVVLLCHVLLVILTCFYVEKIFCRKRIFPD